MSTVRLDNVSKSFGQHRAVDALSLTVGAGELLAVLGPSGCGKTTLLRLIAGFERPDSGRIEIGGETVADGRVFVPPERRRVGMVFQDYALFPHLTVAGNVAFGLARVPRRERRAKVRSVLELVGLQHRADSYPHELSGGERQRVALARALAPDPAVVLLDEPFSNLDETLRADLRREVEVILREAEATAILVTHDQEEALSLADRVAVMRAGRLVQIGTPEEVYARPASRWAAQFVGDVNVVPAVADGQLAHTEIGSFDLACRCGEGPVHVAVRPEQLEIVRDDAGGNGEIVDREFYGHDVLYRVRHESGRTVLVKTSSLELLPVGERVFVRPVRSAVAAPVD